MQNFGYISLGMFQGHELSAEMGFTTTSFYIHKGGKEIAHYHGWDETAGMPTTDDPMIREAASRLTALLGYRMPLPDVG